MRFCHPTIVLRPKVAHIVSSTMASASIFRRVFASLFRPTFRHIYSWPAPSDTTAPAADGWNGTRADRSPPPHADRERQRDRSRSPGRSGEDRGRSNANGPVNLNPGNNIHVSGLSSRVDNRMLEDAFGKFGKVAKASVVYDPHSRESRGFAFVTMDTVEEAEAAIARLVADVLVLLLLENTWAPHAVMIVGMADTGRTDMLLRGHTILVNLIVDTRATDTTLAMTGAMMSGTATETIVIVTAMTATMSAAIATAMMMDVAEATKLVKLSEDNQEQELVDAPFDERMHIPAFTSLPAAKRCLLVLDLNGTLLHRRRTNSGHSSHVYIRPYLGTFLQYISHPSMSLDVAVWSSARRANVDVMVERAWTGKKPDIVLAREDMQLTDRQFKRAYRHGTFRPDHNVRTTKDLRQLWLRMAQVHQGDRVIHGPRDTILLDDSVHKARLQPNNHLALPTYGSAELRADADALTSGFENVDESLIAVVGILSEMRTTDVPFDEWNRTGRVWAGPGAKLDAREMWDGRIRPSSPSPPTTTTTPTRSLTSLPESILAGSSLSARLASRMDASVVKHEPDPPFEPSQQPRIYSEMPQWFSSPPLMRAWIEHGRQILDGLGIRVAHECVQAWPGWKEGNHEIQGKAKDDGLKLRKSDEQRKEKGRRGRGGRSRNRRHEHRRYVNCFLEMVRISSGYHL
ncbi:hypothetical protein RHS01_06702 [Rhizoctonia solani]|uniref:FCP1 homology domain-containing protein n=1 Tax=Rhizoctonia solani TaxID=456999 RepID=A0A8H7IEL7_9AGAM|nr:hypothetical protein RHS01_06702 [Rhizoctonia solani]